MLICDSELCSGCGLCEVVCPVGAIKLIEDKEGFLRPVTDPEKCINCSKCKDKCPVNTGEGNVPEEAYAAYSKNKEIRSGSSSGGVFSHLAEKVIEEGGVVIGAAFKEGLRVAHIAVERVEELSALRGSKYVQSDVRGAYADIEKYLKMGKKVLFSGTPCQCAAVKNLFGERKELILADFICHGVPTPALWEKYVNECHPKATKASFRDKNKGWEEFSMRIASEKGVYSASLYKDPYLRLFLINTPLRPSCYSCSWKGERSVADITLADFWGISKVYPHMNDDRGTSAVLIRSEKGRKLYAEISKELVTVQTKPQIIKELNTAYEKSACRPESREGFFEMLGEGRSFRELSAKYVSPVSSGEIIKIRIKRKIKKIIGKVYKLKAKNR